jgi:hypothetical protein
MRPIVLWYSCIAVQDIANQGDPVSAILATASDMTLVIVFSFITAVILLLWPVFMILIKVICDYVLVIFYKAIRISDAIGGRR